MTDDQERDVELSVEILLPTTRQAPSPSGPLLNGRSSDGVPPRVFDETRRFRVVDRDSAQSQTFNLSRLWFELCAGTWRFQDTFSTERRHFAVVEGNDRHERVTSFLEFPLEALRGGCVKRNGARALESRP